MSSCEATSPPDSIWVIENYQTREWLGTRDRLSMGGLEFGARVPIFYKSVRAARSAWLKLSCDLGYLTRGVTLANGRPIYYQGPNFAAWPAVKYKNMTLCENAFSIDTPADFKVKKKT